jgi:hypothetical protein
LYDYRHIEVLALSKANVAGPGAEAELRCNGTSRLNRNPQPDRVVRRVRQILPSAQIPLGGLNRCMTEEQLDLLKLAAGRAAQLRAGTSQVMGCDSGDANLGCIAPEHLPDDLFAEAFAGDAAVPFHWPKNMTGSDARGRSPRINRLLHPSRHRRGADASMLSNEIDDAPASITLLNMRERERRHFGTS